MRVSGLFKRALELLMTVLSMVSGLGCILSVKVMADWFVMLFCGTAYVILPISPMWTVLILLHSIIYFISGGLSQQQYSTRTMRICVKCLIYMWVGLFSFVVIGSSYLEKHH